MTYNVFGGRLNLALSIYPRVALVWKRRNKSEIQNKHLIMDFGLCILLFMIYVRPLLLLVVVCTN